MRTEREEEEDGEEEKENSSQSLLLMQLDSRSWRANSVSSGKRIQETEEREKREQKLFLSHQVIRSDVHVRPSFRCSFMLLPFLCVLRENHVLHDAS